MSFTTMAQRNAEYVKWANGVIGLLEQNGCAVKVLLKNTQLYPLGSGPLPIPECYLIEASKDGVKVERFLTWLGSEEWCAGMIMWNLQFLKDGGKPEE